GTRATGAAPGARSIRNSTCRGGGNPGKSSGNTSGKSQITVFRTMARPSAVVASCPAIAVVMFLTIVTKRNPFCLGLNLLLHVGLNLLLILIIFLLLAFGVDAVEKIKENTKVDAARLISWQCKKQTVVATSSTEAKYVAAASGYAQVLWMQNQLLDYGVFNSPMLHVLRVKIVINSPWLLSKSWLVQKQTAFGKTATGKESSNPFMAGSLPKRINTPRSDEDRLELMKLMVFLMINGVCSEFGFNAARLLKFLLLAVVKLSGDVTRLQALVDKKRIVITEEVVHEILQLDDAEGVICLPNAEIFVDLARMGYEKPSTKLTFYKAFFSTQWKFLIHTILHSLSAKRTSWNEVGKGFSGVETPLFKNMLAVRAVDAEEEVQVPAQDVVAQENVIEEVAAEVVPPTPTYPSPPSPVIPSSPPHQSPSPPQSQVAEGSSTLVQQVLEKCSDLVLRVECLENANAAQLLEIVKLKTRVKKLERMNKVKLSKLRRLKKVGTSQRIKSLEDEENVFNQGRISVDIDEGIELEEDTEVQGAVEVMTTAKLITKVVTAAAASTPISAATPAAKPNVLKIAAAAPAVSTRKRKRVVIRDPEEELHDDTTAETLSVRDKGKGILVENPKPMKKKDQIEMDAEYAKRLQEEELEKGHGEAYKNIDWNTAYDHVQSKGTQYIKRYHGYKKKPQSESKARKNMIAYLKNTEGFKMAYFKGKHMIKFFQFFKLAQRQSKEAQRMTEEAQEAGNLRGHLEIVPNKGDDVFVEAVPLSQKAPIMDYQRIVKDIFSSKKPTNFLDEYLLLTLKTMFGELDTQDAIWRSQKSIHGLSLVKRWKLLKSCGVHVIILSTVQLFLLVERRYPLPRFTLEQLVNVARLQAKVKNAAGAAYTKKFNRYSFFETPKILLLAWDRVFEIKEAFGNKQYKPEDIQELFRKLFNDVQNIHEELAKNINTPNWNRPAFYSNDEDDDEEFSIPMSEIYKSSLAATTPNLPITGSLIMEDEHLDTILEMESDKLIKSSVENLVPNPSESEGLSEDLSEDLSDIESECDVPVCDDFTTFSNPLFDADINFSSSDDESFFDTDVSKKIYSNPLFDEEIISIKIDPHHFNAESDLIESFLNQDSLIISSPKIDSLLEESSGELAHIDLIPLGSNEADFDREEEIRLVEKFFDSLMEDIDLFLAFDGSIPSGIDSDYSDSEGNNLFSKKIASR
nr:putative ribonuclease H-like domain-containing protein [Tanacetum cinerariifolium]